MSGSVLLAFYNCIFNCNWIIIIISIVDNSKNRAKIAKKAIWHKGFSIVDNYVDNLWITQKSMWKTCG